MPEHQAQVQNHPFSMSVEVVPPAGHDAGPLLATLKSLNPLPFNRFSVATNPLAKPRMSALALCALIQKATGRPATLHCTTRDHNRLSLQGLLWGTRALGIESVLAATGDFVALGDRARTTTVRDVDIFALVRLARQVGLHTGVVLDPYRRPGAFEQEVRRLERKVEAGAQYVITQPIYDQTAAQELAQATEHLGIPVILGILPLRTARHAHFLHHQVAGILVPEPVRERMARADDPVTEGAANAREVLALARQYFAGACLMPPFDHYEVLFDILKP